MFFAKRCQGPNKTASAAEKFSVKECEEEREKAKACKERVGAPRERE